MSLSTKLSQLALVSRSSDWRLSFIPFIIGCVYLWLYYFDISFRADSLILFVLSLLTSIGFASLGYFINEFFDKEVDKKAGKLNKLSFLKPQYQFLLFLFTLSLTLLPWLGLPFDKISLSLISLELSLFLVYSLPFPRLKVVPLLSNIIDSLYAYVIPLLLAFYTYSLFSREVIAPFILLFGLLVFIIGFRNILIHQINDVFKDKKAGISNIPVKLGVHNTNFLLKYLLLLEFITVNVFSIVLLLQKPLFTIWLVIYNVFVIFSFLNRRKALDSIYFPILPERQHVDKAYQIGFPLITLMLLLFIDYRWLILLPFHLLILTPVEIFIPLKKSAKSTYYKLIVFITVDLRSLFSFLINYPIYLMFLIFGVNLKKEQKSALQYLRDKLL